MDTQQIVESLNSQIHVLQRVREILAGKPVLREHPVKIAPQPRRAYIMSPEGRKNIAAAQRKRWAKLKAA